MAFLFEQRSAWIAEEVSEHLTVAHLFEPDTTLPFQYAELLRRKTYVEGEKDSGSLFWRTPSTASRNSISLAIRKGNGFFTRLKNGSRRRRMTRSSPLAMSAARWGSIPDIYVGD